MGDRWKTTGKKFLDFEAKSTFMRLIESSVGSKPYLDERPRPSRVNILRATKIPHSRLSPQRQL